MVLTGVVNDWPAIRTWKNYASIKARVSDSSLRVPVEVGGDYMSSNMRMTDMNFHKLLDIFQDRQNIIESTNNNINHHSSSSSSQSNSSGKHMYVAQYDLSNIPELIPDIAVPSILNDIANTDKLYAIKFWLGGPSGTISPCHYDPYDNMLCQVLGAKHILLFPPESRTWLYPYHNTTQKNTSQIPFSSTSLSTYTESVYEQHVIIIIIINIG